MTRRNHSFLQICVLAGFFVYMMAFNSTRSSAFDLNDIEKRALSEEEVGLRGKTITHMQSGKEQVFTTSFKDLDTFAELSDDPKDGLSSSFTICSAVTREEGTFQTFFSLLGGDGKPFVQAFLYSTHPENKRSTFYYKIKDVAFSPNMTIPIVFPFEWTHSCLAVSTKQGLLRWVVDGFIIEDTIYETLKDASLPKSLLGKILLGVYFGTSGWSSISHKTSNVNVFSSALSIERMQTIARVKGCDEEGDYIAWSKSAWTVHGEASIETKEETRLRHQ